MTAPFLVRSAVLADYDQLCALWEIGDSLHREAVPHMFRASGQPSKSRTEVEALLADPDRTILVAIREGNVIGLMTLLEKRTAANAIFAERRHAEVDNMVVGPSFQRQGVGSALLEAAAAWAKTRGIERLELSVYNFNDGAQALYRKAGFAPLLQRMSRKL